MTHGGRREGAGRPPGVASTCTFCSGVGHNSSNGVCSKAKTAQRYADENKLTPNQAVVLVRAATDRSFADRRMRMLLKRRSEINARIRALRAVRKDQR